MKSHYEQEINDYLKNGGTVTHLLSDVKEADDTAEAKLLQESVTTIRDLEPHEVTAISWGQAMSEADGGEEDRKYWTDLNRTLDAYIKKNNVPVLQSSKLF